MKHRRSLLSTTNIGVTMLWLAAASCSNAAYAFDINEGAQADTQPSYDSSVRVGNVLPQSGAKRNVILFPKLRPEQPPVAPIAFAPLGAPAPVVAQSAPAVELPPIQFPPLKHPSAPVARKITTMENTSVVPAPVYISTPLVVATPAAPVLAQPVPAPTRSSRAFPPVSPEVAARAQAELNNSMPAEMAETPLAPPPVPAPVSVLAPIRLTPPPSMREAEPVAAAPAQAGYIAALPTFGKMGTAQVVTTPSAVPAEPFALPPRAANQSAPIVNIPVVKLVPAQNPVAAPAPEASMTPTLTPQAAPLSAPTPAPIVPSSPIPPAVLPPSAREEKLSRSTKSIIGTIPSKMDTVKPEKSQKFSMSRTNPSVDALEIKKGAKKDAYEAAGIKISVSRPGLDTNYELNRAYNALAGGDSEMATQIYKDVLSAEPTNPDALFGLASIYHRQGQVAKARPLYGVLLKNYPTHREGINNFLVLVSDESPQEALAELERLEQRNPDFSPIPAQEGMVLDRLGYASEAQAKMMRAIELAPENLTYKYNLAIMLDRQKNYTQAADFYRVLIDAANKGAPIPASVDVLQKRLNYISTVTTSSAILSTVR